MREWCKIILMFKANTKRLTFTEKRQTRINHGHVVTSAVGRKRDAKSLYSLYFEET